MRSWLLIPAGNAARLARAASLPADVMVVDFHADGSETTADTRTQAASWLDAQRGNAAGFARWVRIKPVNAPQWREDVAAVMASKPDGIIMSDAEHPDEVRRLGSELYELEQRHGIAPNSMPLVIEVGATARGAMAIERMTHDPHPRVAGVTWNPAVLARDTGSVASAGKLGWSAPLAHVRGQAVLVARSLGAMAIEAPNPGWRDMEGFERSCALARRDGFDAMMAVHPAQLEVINTRFEPTAAERDEASQIIELFEKEPAASMVPLNGRMVDRAQLARARRTIG